MGFPNLLESKKHDLDLRRQRLEWGLFVTPVRRGVLKDMLGSRDVAKSGFDLIQETAQAGHDLTLKLLLVALGDASIPTVTRPVQLNVGEIAALLAAGLVARDFKNWTCMEEAEQTLVYYELLERTRSACTWLPRVLTSLAMADEQVRVMMYSLLESDDPTKIRQGALCIVFELDDIMRAIRRGLHVRWETNQAADAWHTRLHDRLEKARTLAMHQFSWWRDRDHTTAALFLRTLSKVVAGFGLLGQYNTMMNLTQTVVTEWATQQKEQQPCSAALAMTYMEVLESAARHLPVDKAPDHQALFIQGVSQCDTVWTIAVAMIQDRSRPPEHLIHAQEVVTAANLCISAVLRLGFLWPGEPAENPNAWVLSYLNGAWNPADRLAKLVSVVPGGDTGGDWLFDLTPLHASLRRFTMLLCKLAPTALGLLANMAMEEGANAMAVMGLLVGATRVAAKAHPEGREAVVQACIHVWKLGQAHGYVMACMGGLLRSEPSRRTSEPMTSLANSAADILLGVSPDMPELFGACSLFKALAAACAGHMDEKLEEVWGKHVSDLMCVVVRVSEEGRAEDKAFQRQEQRRAVLESLVASLPAGIILPTVTRLLAEVTSMFTTAGGEGVDEGGMRRQLAARLGVGTQVLKAARSHIHQGDQETRTCVEAMSLHMVNASSARALFKEGVYSENILRGGVRFLHAALSALPMAEAHDGFIAQLLTALEANAADARMGELLLCLLETLVDIFTTWPRLWPDSILKRALAGLTCFCVDVNRGVTGLSRWEPPREGNFNWLVCGREAASFARALQHIAQAQQYDFGSLLPVQNKTQVPALLTQFVGSAPGAEDGEGEAEGEGQDLGGEMMLEEEWALDSGE